MKNIKRGELYFIDCGDSVVDATGSEQKGIRPMLIIQNDIGNKYSPTTIAIALTSKAKKEIPTHVFIHKNETNGLKSDSVILCEQFRTIDKTRIKSKIGQVDENTLNRVLDAVKVSLAML